MSQVYVVFVSVFVLSAVNRCVLFACCVLVQQAATAVHYQCLRVPPRPAIPPLLRLTRSTQLQPKTGMCAYFASACVLTVSPSRYYPCVSRGGRFAALEAWYHGQIASMAGATAGASRDRACLLDAHLFRHCRNVSCIRSAPFRACGRGRNSPGRPRVSAVTPV